MSAPVIHPELRAAPSEADVCDVTVIVPAYNEADHVGDTIRSLQTQTVRPRRILVVDDGSTDGTGEVARALGADVVRPDRNTGSKAGAQTFALGVVDTEYCMAVDADTVVAPDGIERLMPALADPDVAAACGFVLPRRVRSVWERGRYVEYLFAFGFLKPVQDHYGRPMISSGCFSAYRTDALRQVGGWHDRTLAEDVDLTWTLYDAGWKVRFVPGATCYPVEPQTFHYLRKQLRRWSHGFLQNVRLHWRDVRHHGYLASTVAVATWDAVVASVVFLAVLPVLALFVDHLFALGYVIDAPVVLVPVAFTAATRRELGRAIVSYPSFLVLRVVNAVFMLRAFWQEFIRRKPLVGYEKGH
jgi:biofilm PGA synthesis N-glycosyltransferase PgaC